MTHRFRAHLVPLLLAVACTGCTSGTRVFPDHDAGVVWTAMVAVADTPDYGADDDPWIVKENRAYTRPDERRIEIYREVVRHSDLEKVNPFVDRRAFRFQVLLEETNPPTVSIISRGTGFPRHAEEEVRRYLDDVSVIVGDRSRGPLPEGGASTPEIAVRDLIYAMFRRDADEIQRVILPADDAELLWTGEALDVLPPAARSQLDRRIIRPARVDEVIEIDGTRVRVTEPYVEGDRRIVLATVAGSPLAPFEVVRVGDRWRVDATRIIARRRARE